MSTPSTPVIPNYRSLTVIAGSIAELLRLGHPGTDWRVCPYQTLERVALDPDRAAAHLFEVLSRLAGHDRSEVAFRLGLVLGRERFRRPVDDRR